MIKKLFLSFFHTETVNKLKYRYLTINFGNLLNVVFFLNDLLKKDIKVKLTEKHINKL